MQQEIDGLRRGGSEFEFKLQEYQSTISSLEGRLKSANQENDELRRRLGELSDVNRKVAEYENRIALMSSEIERLNGTLKSKVEENGNLQKQLRSAQDQIDELRRGTNESGIRITQITQ